MKTRSRLASTRHPLGSFGLLLVGLVGRLAPLAYSGQTDHRRIKAFLARRAIDGIAVIGWTVGHIGDWVSPGRTSRAARRDALEVAPRRRRKPA